MRRIPAAGWMVVVLVLAWVLDFALYLTGMRAFAFSAASALIVLSIPWVLLAVVVSFLEMRNATARAREARHEGQAIDRDA